MLSHCQRNSEDSTCRSYLQYLGNAIIMFTKLSKAKKDCCGVPNAKTGFIGGEMPLKAKREGAGEGRENLQIGMQV